MHGIHPTFIQTMLGNNRFSNSDVLSSIEHLKKSGGKNLIKIYLIQMIKFIMENVLKMVAKKKYVTKRY